MEDHRELSIEWARHDPEVLTKKGAQKPTLHLSLTLYLGKVASDDFSDCSLDTVVKTEFGQDEYLTEVETWEEKSYSRISKGKYPLNFCVKLCWAFKAGLTGEPPTDQEAWKLIGPEIALVDRLELVVKAALARLEEKLDHVKTLSDASNLTRQLAQRVIEEAYSVMRYDQRFAALQAERDAEALVQVEVIVENTDWDTISKAGFSKESIDLALANLGLAVQYKLEGTHATLHYPKPFRVKGDDGSQG